MTVAQVVLPAAEVAKVVDRTTHVRKANNVWPDAASVFPVAVAAVEASAVSVSRTRTAVIATTIMEPVDAVELPTSSARASAALASYKPVPAVNQLVSRATVRMGSLARTWQMRLVSAVVDLVAL
jgi:hypothetical protein